MPTRWLGAAFGLVFLLALATAQGAPGCHVDNHADNYKCEPRSSPQPTTRQLWPALTSRLACRSPADAHLPLASAALLTTTCS